MTSPDNENHAFVLCTQSTEPQDSNLSVAPSGVSDATITKEHTESPTVKPADDVAEATPSSVPDVEATPSPTEENFGYDSPDFFSYVFMLAVFVVIGILLWWAGVHKRIAKLRSRSTKGKYMKVGSEDVEKALD